MIPRLIPRSETNTLDTKYIWVPKKEGTTIQLARWIVVYVDAEAALDVSAFKGDLGRLGVIEKSLTRGAAAWSLEESDCKNNADNFVIFGYWFNVHIAKHHSLPRHKSLYLLVSTS